MYWKLFPATESLLAAPSILVGQNQAPSDVWKHSEPYGVLEICLTSRGFDVDAFPFRLTARMTIFGRGLR